MLRPAQNRDQNPCQQGPKRDDDKDMSIRSVLATCCFIVLLGCGGASTVKLGLNWQSYEFGLSNLMVSVGFPPNEARDVPFEQSLTFVDVDDYRLFEFPNTVQVLEKGWKFNRSMKLGAHAHMFVSIRIGRIPEMSDFDISTISGLRAFQLERYKSAGYPSTRLRGSISQGGRTWSQIDVQDAYKLRIFAAELSPSIYIEIQANFVGYEKGEKNRWTEEASKIFDQIVSTLHISRVELTAAL